MKEERFLVTGGTGCIGSWVVKNLVNQGVPTAILSSGKRYQRLQLLLSKDEIEKIHIYTVDISQTKHVFDVFDSFGVTNVIHLAALQIPFCKADPVKGSLVNVTGTVNIFEAAKKFNVKHIVYASSTAVYGVSEEYPEGALAHDAKLLPRSLYGVYKQANEGTARIYWMDDHISSIGLRPYVVYGSGRDQGMSSTPTKAMMAAVLDKPYEISFGGRYGLQFGDDVGKTFIQASRTDFTGAEIFNIGGPSVSSDEVIKAIENEVPSMKGKITHTENRMPFPEEIDNSELQKAIGKLPYTELQKGVSMTIETYRNALKKGILSEEDLLNLMK